jgi:hypothetical protein
VLDRFRHKSREERLIEEWIKVKIRDHENSANLGGVIRGSVPAYCEALRKAE